MRTFKTILAASLVACTLAPISLLPAGIEIPTDLSQKEKPATIKVLIDKQKPKIFLEAKGRYNVYNPQNEYLLTSGASTNRHDDRLQLSPV